MDHMLFALSRLPEKDFDASDVCSNVSFVDENIALYPLSQNCAMDSKALFAMSGKMWHLLAARGVLGMSRSAVCVASIDMLLGSKTFSPGSQCSMLVQCTPLPRKWLVHPESAIAVVLECTALLAALFFSLCFILGTIGL